MGEMERKQEWNGGSRQEKREGRKAEEERNSWLGRADEGHGRGIGMDERAGKEKRKVMYNG